MVEVRDKPAKASLRLPAVLNGRFKYARMAPFIMYGRDMSRPGPACCRLCCPTTFYASSLESQGTIRASVAAK